MRSNFRRRSKIQRRVQCELQCADILKKLVVAISSSHSVSCLPSILLSGPCKESGNWAMAEAETNRLWVFNHSNRQSIKPEMQKVGDTGDISLLFFLAGANFWATHAKICTSASSTSAISTCGISTGTMSTSSISTIRLRLGSINKCYAIFQVFMVDWQFTVFCCKVGFVEIYAFLVLIFLAKIVSVFLLLFASLLPSSLLSPVATSSSFPPQTSPTSNTTNIHQFHLHYW